jgi:hypothetical protein
MPSLYPIIEQGHPKAEQSAMPTDWADKVRAAITNLETKADRVLEPDQALAIIDDVVEGKFAAADRPQYRSTNFHPYCVAL